MYDTPDFHPDALASLTLTRMPGLTMSQALELVRHYGSAQAALDDDHSPSEIWRKVRGCQSALQTARDRAQVELDYCAAHGVQVIPYSSSAYPTLLQGDEVADAPLQLFYRGTGELNRRHVLSVVGTRHITEYGKQFCEDFFRELARQVPDVLIVSGLAYGVDIHAHRAALANGLDTVAVLAHGHDRLYPPMHKATAQEMTLHGGLLTEYFTHTVPDKGNFVRRNRIVAGIATGTLVVESASRGGALITARLACDYGRDVMAVPGRINDEYSAGCNHLIRDQRASLVTSVDDVMRVMNWESVENRKNSQPQLFPVLTPEQERLVAALREHEDLSADRLSALTGIAVPQLADMLFDLEDLSVVKRLPGNRYRLTGFC